MQDPALFDSYKKQVLGTEALTPDLQEQHMILDMYSGFNMSQVSQHPLLFASPP